MRATPSSSPRSGSEEDKKSQSVYISRHVTCVRGDAKWSLRTCKLSVIWAKDPQGTKHHNATQPSLLKTTQTQTPNLSHFNFHSNPPTHWPHSDTTMSTHLTPPLLTHARCDSFITFVLVCESFSASMWFMYPLPHKTH